MSGAFLRGRRPDKPLSPVASGLLELADNLACVLELAKFVRWSLAVRTRCRAEDEIDLIGREQLVPVVHGLGACLLRVRGSWVMQKEEKACVV